MTVAQGIAGPEGRPDVDALGMDGVTLAGDWIGPDGMLADAAVASGLRAAEAVQRKKSRAA
jgi:predicted NAD/FAD-dependent oxidoreductase